MTRDDYTGRLDRLRAEMARAGVGLTAIAPTSNMRYLLGFSPLADERLCLLLITQEGARLIVPELNAEQMEARTGVTGIAWKDDQGDDQGPGEALQQALDALGGIGQALLAADGAMRADALLPLQEAASPDRITTASHLVGSLRARKSAEEIEALARAAAQADRAMMIGIERCGPGVKERDVGESIAR